MQLHGVRDWKKGVSSRLAVITEEFPSALQSILLAKLLCWNMGLVLEKRAGRGIGYPGWWSIE